MRVFLAAVIAFAVTTPLVLVGTSGHALHNGDEAIYAEMAREMTDSGRAGVLTWQGAPVFPRPPAQVWLLAATRRAFAWPDERAVRWPLAVTCGLEVALVLVLGAALFGLGAGLVAAGMLATSDLFLGYARYLESEPLLCVFVALALLAWEHSRTRPRFLYAWGALAGAALMTKQLVGAVAFLPPFVDALARPRPERLPWWRGLAAAAAVWLPWHVWAAARYGRPFLHSYFLANLLERGTAAMHHTTLPTFYVRELWRSEGPFALIVAAAVAWAGVVAVRRRDRGELLIAIWSVGVFVVYSVARSRYDYYLLLAYPAFALATGWAVARLPVSPRVRALAGAALVVAAALAHAPRNLSAFAGDGEVRALAGLATTRLAAPARLYTYNTHPYSARYYTTLDVTTLVESEADLHDAMALARLGLPAPVEWARDLRAELAVRPRPFALLLPRARADLVTGAKLLPLGATPHYLLYLGE